MSKTADARHLIDQAEALLRTGEPGKALEALSRALALAPNLAAVPYARVLADVSPRAWFPRLDADLRFCLAAPGVDPQRLARVAARLLLRKYPGPDMLRAAHDPLWIAFLTRCINVDPEMEARLVFMTGAAPTGELRAALARQAFASEYVWGGEELAIPPEAHLELAEERTLAAAMPAVAATADSASGAVQAHREASPCPRWRAPPAPARVAIRDVLRDLGGAPDEPLEVLVAGCGTGYEPIDLARTDPSIQVTALDPSRASLAYGQRMARTLGVGNVGFVAGSLLDAARLDQRFDLVTSTGLLHHLAEPEKGLVALAGVLKPGGLLRIALPGERAGHSVGEARRLIADRGWGAAIEGVRAFRAHVLALPPRAPLARLRDSDDFYTLSGCRDLCFQAHEHRYRLPQIGEMLAGAGLELVGLDLPPEAARFAADRRDLAAWDAIEAKHPRLFAGMYHLWCRPAQAA